MLRKTFLFFLLYGILLSEDSSIALLTKVYNNSVFVLVDSKTYYCKPYGVVTIEELFSYSKNIRCKKEIVSLYNKQPSLQYFAMMVLKEQQKYHIQFKNGRCLLYAQGMTSYSEMLLTQGLALLPLSFKDKEFQYLFMKAQKNAKLAKRGLWKSSIPIICHHSGIF